MAPPNENTAAKHLTQGNTPEEANHKQALREFFVASSDRQINQADDMSLARVEMKFRERVRRIGVLAKNRDRQK